MKLEECQLRRVSLLKLAEAVDYEPNYVCAVVNGRTKPGRKFLKRLEKVPLESVMKQYARTRLKTDLNES
jgi:transcriptional regulator with XRE-family HTH domain